MMLGFRREKSIVRREQFSIFNSKQFLIGAKINNLREKVNGNLGRLRIN
jgi:hypothetical protein